MNTNTMPVHEGRNVKRIREILGVKQEALAIDLGLSQQAVSLMEQKETLDIPTLEKVANALHVPVEAIKNFDEQATVYNIQNNYDESNAGANNISGCNSGNNNGSSSTYTFNPLEKYVEQVEENKLLYQALLKEKDEKIAILERLMEKK